MQNLLIFELARILSFHRNTVEKSMNEIGLHSGQIFILISLWKDDGQTQVELSKNLQISPPTVYNMVTRMAELDLVKLNKCEKDARAMRVHLTEKGQSLQKSAEKQWEKLEKTVFEGWAETEKMMFSLLLKKFRNIA